MARLFAARSTFPALPRPWRGRGSVLAPYTTASWYQRHPTLCFCILGFTCFFYGAAWALAGRYVLPFLVLPMLPVLGLVLWMLPETGQPHERWLVRGLFAYLIALLAWPDYIALDIPGLPWISLIRVIGIPLVFLFFVSLSVSRDYRARGVAILRSSPLIWRLVVAFAIIGLLSIGMSIRPFFSLQKFVVAQLNWTAIFFISCFVFAIPNMVNRLAFVLWAIVVPVCAIGIWEGHLRHLPWLGHIPSFLAIQDEGVQRVLRGVMRAGSDRYRVQSKFGTSLGLGEFLALSTPFILHFASRARTLAVRVGAMATIPLIGYTVFLTDSRLAVIGLLTTLAMYVFFLGVIRWKHGKNDMIGSVIVFGYPALLGFMLAATLFIGRLRARVWGDGSQQASNDARQGMYELGIPMVMKNPVGHGFGMGGETLGWRSPDGLLTIDTYYLTIALEVGILGFLVYFGMIVAAIYKSSRIALARPEGEFEWLGPIAIALCNFIVIKSVFSGMENHPLVFAMLGIVVALSYRAAQVPSPRLPAR